MAPITSILKGRSDFKKKAPNDGSNGASFLEKNVLFLIVFFLILFI